jgi:phage portal protein BeeE
VDEEPIISDLLELRSASLSRVFEEIVESRKSVAGVAISPETALECSAVLACVRLLSESIAAMPTNLYRRLPGGGKEIAADQPLHDILAYQPNSWMTSFEFKELMQSWLLLWGNAYAYIKGSSRRGAVDELIPLHPSRMDVKRLENGKLRYYYREPATIADPSPEPTEYRQDEIFHLRSWLRPGGTLQGVDWAGAGDRTALIRIFRQWREGRHLYRGRSAAQAGGSPAFSSAVG